MNSRTCLSIVILALLSGGCSSMLIKNTKAPIRYQLTYKTAPINCSASFDKGLRVWNFTAISPYDQTQMVVEKPEGQTLSSNTYQWVANPGEMVAQSLLRDLSMGTMFTQVVSAEDPTNVKLDMTGRVFEFAWRRTGASSRAVLEVEISVSSTGANPAVVFRKSYNLKSPPFTEDSSETFAGAMSSLMGEFSRQLRQDLCTAASSEASARMSLRVEEGHSFGSNDETVFAVCHFKD